MTCGLAKKKRIKNGKNFPDHSAVIFCLDVFLGEALVTLLRGDRGAAGGLQQRHAAAAVSWEEDESGRRDEKWKTSIPTSRFCHKHFYQSRNWSTARGGRSSGFRSTHAYKQLTCWLGSNSSSVWMCSVRSWPLFFMRKKKTWTGSKHRALSGTESKNDVFAPQWVWQRLSASERWGGGGGGRSFSPAVNSTSCSEKYKAENIFPTRKRNARSIWCASCSKKKHLDKKYNNYGLKTIPWRRRRQTNSSAELN